MSKDGLQAFETAIDFVIDRTQRMDLCRKCAPRVDKFLKALVAELRVRKVLNLEVELANVIDGLDAIVAARP